MNYALFCSVADERFYRDGTDMWVKLFATEEFAELWGMQFLSEILKSEELEGIDMLADFQDTLDPTDYFHIYRVIE